MTDSESWAELFETVKLCEVFAVLKTVTKLVLPED